ncbi:MAG: DUF1016 N-terminal domain-containing protein [Methanomassiliicoccaceae archaeon]|nr:DUF1016 N-terminal domain-containing protein [Methanomassiliicoccaceae archaeon]
MRHNPGVSGFSPQNIWRMKQFYETYEGSEMLSALMRELSWTLNLMIMTAKTDTEREFYLRLAIKNNYSSRELERQMNSCLYERTMLSKNFGTNAHLMTSFFIIIAIYGHEGVDIQRKSEEGRRDGGRDIRPERYREGTRRGC